MLIQGMAGVQRRLYDGGASYQHAQDVLWLNQVMAWSAWGLGLAQVFFIVNFFRSLRRGAPAAEANEWQATTLEWSAAPSPPPHGNFPVQPVVHRGPYEYSVPGMERDFLPQDDPGGPPPRPPAAGEPEPVPAE
jgi:cytochrome c oxidase subunit 1